MAIVQCKNKHYYDNSKYNECPHCKRMNSPFSPVVDSSDKTVAVFKPASPEFAHISNDSQNSSDDNPQKTVGIFMQKNNIDPVAGWIVGIEGENRGRSFEVHINNNSVGRSMKNDIKINDLHISREKHFVITYDPQSAKFFVSPGNGLTYFNGKSLTEAAELSDGDKITAGESSYIFIPYCREGRDWSE